MDDPPTDVLDPVCNVGIARRFGFDKAGREILVDAIEGNALKEDDVKAAARTRSNAGKATCEPWRMRRHLSCRQGHPCTRRSRSTIR